MRLVKKLELLLNYYLINRKVGHTAVLKEGTKHYDKDLLILASYAKDWQFLECKPNQIISWQNLDKLCGHAKPLVIDNESLIEILSETIEELEKLKDENEKLLRRNQLILVSPKDVLYKKIVELEEEIERFKSSQHYVTFSG